MKKQSADAKIFKNVPFFYEIPSQQTQITHISPIFLCFLTTTKHIVISYKGNVPFVQGQCTFSTIPMYD